MSRVRFGCISALPVLTLLLVVGASSDSLAGHGDGGGGSSRQYNSGGLHFATLVHFEEKFMARLRLEPAAKGFFSS